jgi:SRSO17 transposase
VARQYIGSRGKIDNGIVAVTTLWVDERCYWLMSGYSLRVALEALKRAGSPF